MLGLALVALGLAKVAAGTCALTAAILASENATGVPRWIPHGLALVLAVTAFACAMRRLDFMALAAFWALGAGAFARPALLLRGWPEPRIEWAFVPVLVALLALVASRTTSSSIRFAVAAALLAAAAVALTLICDPVGIVAPRAAPLAYTAVLLAALLAAGRAIQYRRRRHGNFR